MVRYNSEHGGYEERGVNAGIVNGERTSGNDVFHVKSSCCFNESAGIAVAIGMESLFQNLKACTV